MPSLLIEVHHLRTGHTVGVQLSCRVGATDPTTRYLRRGLITELPHSWGAWLSRWVKRPGVLHSTLPIIADEITRVKLSRVRYPTAKARGLNLSSTAKRQSVAALPLWLHHVTYQGVLTTRPCS